jgi:hypothetical protein
MRIGRAVVLGLLSLLVAAGGGRAEPASGTPSLASLLARYSPVLVLHPDERFEPVAVDGFLADSDLERQGPAGWEKVVGTPPPGGPDLRLDQRFCSPSAGIAASDCYAGAEDAHVSPATVYGNASRHGKRIVLQYWFFYVYDAYSPTVPAGDLWQVHEGDWEAISVLLDLRGRPLLAAYSQHGRGVRRDWAKVPRRRTHPLVYVALGSHANYFGPGTHRFDPRVVEPIFISIIEQNGFVPADHAGNGRVLRPVLVRVTASSPSWMAFAGFWGEGQYLHAPGNAPVMLGTSPHGPAFHAQWRSPVRAVLGWPRG